MSSDTSTTKLNYCAETTFGNLPAGPAFRAVRFTGETFGHKKEVVQSLEITPDRQVQDLVKVNAAADGALNFELSIPEYLPFWLAALGQSAWTTISKTEVIQEVNLAGQFITFDDVPGTEMEAFVGSGYVEVSGAATPGNNGVKRVLSYDDGGGSSTFTVYFAPGSFVATEAIGLPITLTRLQAVNGVAQKHFAFERGVLMDDGVSRAWQNFHGMTVGNLSLKVASKEIITGSIGFAGKVGGYLDRSLNRAGEIAATGTLTLSGVPLADTTVTIGNKVYIWKAAPTTGANEVRIGATASFSLDNLIAAINLAAGAGTLYGSLTTKHSQVSAAAGAGDTMIVTASLANQTGTFGNTIATLETMANGAWGGATLTGGVDANAILEATTAEVLNGTNNVTSLSSGTTVLSDPAKEFSFNINNNLRPKDKIGLEGAFEMGQGQFNVTGNLNTYFEDNALFQKIIDHANVSLSILLNDSSGAMIGITFPRVKLATGNPNTTANNADVMMSIDWTALKDPTTGVTMIVDAFGVV